MPEDFKFPSTDVKTMWDLWYFGHAGIEVQPYKKLCEGFAMDLRTGVERVNLCRANKVMKKLYQIALANGDINEGDDIGHLSRGKSDEVFDKAYGCLLRELYTREQHRAGSKTVNTIALRMGKGNN